MDRAVLSSAIERAVRTGIQVITGAGLTEATGADLSTTAGVLQFIITTIVTALVMAYATPAKQDVQKTPDPVFVPTTVNDALKGTVEKVLPPAAPVVNDVLDEVLKVPNAALDELRKRFGR